MRPSRLVRGGRAALGATAARAAAPAGAVVRSSPRRLVPWPLAVLSLLAFGCRGGEVPPARPAAAVIAAHAESLLALPGVVGLYQALGARGDTVLRVMVVSGADSTRRRLPRRLEGWRVEVEVGGRIEPM